METRDIIYYSLIVVGLGGVGYMGYQFKKMRDKIECVSLKVEEYMEHNGKGSEKKSDLEDRAKSD